MIAALSYAWLSGRVRAAPYAYELARATKRFGWLAVFGDRQATALELREMTIAEDIVSAWSSAKRASNLADWAGENRGESELLDWARALSERVYGAD
jgi:hypothetical protein